MGEGTDATPGTEGQQAYERLLTRRLRRADLAVRLRAGGIQAVWIVVLIAGAAVPLAESTLTDAWSWVTPTLGFVVVVAAGLERIFSRTADAAVPLDQLRRSIARERRLLLASAGVYGERDASFSLFAERVEGHIAVYDEQMVSYGKRQLAGE